MRIIAGCFKNREIKTPKGLATRPTSSQLRESLFNICQTKIDEAVFLDLFAGSGAMGLEALSRGAAKVLFVEKDSIAASCIRDNIQELKVHEKAQLIRGDVFNVLPKLGMKGECFDLIYIDPPYAEKYGEKVLQLIDELDLLKAEGWLFVEDAHGNIDPERKYQRLVLHSQRRMGRSTLFQYTSSVSTQA